MRTPEIRGPLVSIMAVAVVGTGLWLVNTAAEPAPAPAVVSVPTAAPVPAAVPGFPSAAGYSGEIITPKAPIVVDLTVTRGTARAYVCDGYEIETWLSGTVTGDAVTLSNADGSERLTARLENTTVVGTLSLGQRSWELRAEQVTDGQ